MGFEAARYWRLTNKRNSLVCDKILSGTPNGSWEFRGAKAPVVTEELLLGMVKDIKDDKNRKLTLDGYRQQLSVFMKTDSDPAENYGGGK